MFFTASKVFAFFVLPSSLLITLSLVGAILLLTRFARAGRRLMVASALLLAVAAWSPLGLMLTLPLEQRFPAWDPARGAPDGIIVLGGAIDELTSARRGETALGDAAERLTTPIALARRYPQARILFSGGSGRLIFRGVTESDIAARFFADLGLPAERLTFENRSRNTSENAAYSRDLAKPKPGERWLLVTSAMHMPRAMGIFRQVGFDVEAYPVDWRTRGDGDVYRLSLTASEGLRRTDAAVHEWVGLAVYRLTGQTPEVFPGPQR